MVDTQLLDDRIDSSGKRKTYLAKKLGISVQAFRMKRLNLSKFDTDQVNILCDELSITKLSDKEKIFFKK